MSLSLEEPIIVLMESQVIREHIEQLQTHHSIESVKQIANLCFNVAYTPQLTNSPYSHLNYGIRLSIPESYPQNPPFLAFLDKIYHVNVDPITGQVHMAILKEDWSSFLNLTAVFSSLDCLLEEPDPQYAASLTLQQEYLQEPDKYAQKVGQMINLCTFRPNTSNDYSREVEIVNLNNSSEEIVQDRKEMEHMMNSIPLTEIQIKNKDSFESPIGDMAKQIRIEEKEEPSVLKGEKGQVESLKLLRSGDGIYFGQDREKKITKSKKKEEERQQQFQQIQQSLRKSEQLIEILLKGCESMQNTVRGCNNLRMKQLLEKKLEGQWVMIEELLQMTGKLKEKLFNDLKKETKMLLK